MHVSTPAKTVRAGDESKITIDNVIVECQDQGEPSTTATVTVVT